MLIYELSRAGRVSGAQLAADAPLPDDLPPELLRTSPLGLPEVSELQAVRHYTNLSRKNFSIDTHFYPLGSCTMKYNPRACNSLAMLDGFLMRHPSAPAAASTSPFLQNASTVRAADASSDAPTFAADPLIACAVRAASTRSDESIWRDRRAVRSSVERQNARMISMTPSRPAASSSASTCEKSTISSASSVNYDASLKIERQVARSSAQCSANR